jgi:hypothetical protein
MPLRRIYRQYDFTAGMRFLEKALRIAGRLERKGAVDRGAHLFGIDKPPIFINWSRLGCVT